MYVVPQTGCVLVKENKRVMLSATCYVRKTQLKMNIFGLNEVKFIQLGGLLGPSRYPPKMFPKGHILRARYISSAIPRIKPVRRRFYASQVEPLPTKITTLSNKIRVATEATPGHFSAVGVYIDAGSRYEATQYSGVSHILDRMAFKVRLSIIPSHKPPENGTFFHSYALNLSISTNLSLTNDPEHQSTFRGFHVHRNRLARGSDVRFELTRNDDVSIIAFPQRHSASRVNSCRHHLEPAFPDRRTGDAA